MQYHFMPSSAYCYCCTLTLNYLHSVCSLESEIFCSVNAGFHHASVVNWPWCCCGNSRLRAHLSKNSLVTNYGTRSPRARCHVHNYGCAKFGANWPTGRFWANGWNITNFLLLWPTITCCCCMVCTSVVFALWWRMIKVQKIIQYWYQSSCF